MVDCIPAEIPEAVNFWGYAAGAGFAVVLWAIREIWVQWRFEKTGRL
jgi:hypothetical protein